jgi:hypothetical protein
MRKARDAMINASGADIMQKVDSSSSSTAAAAVDIGCLNMNMPPTCMLPALVI